MSVNIKGTLYGCADALEARAHGIRRAGQRLSQHLLDGGTLPSTYLIAGVTYNVTKVDVTPDGGTNNHTQLNSAYNQFRDGTPTLLVLPPTDTPYRYDAVLNVSENTYLCGYGAMVKPLGVNNYAHKFGGDNAGIFGLTMLGDPGTMSKWPERFEDNTTSDPAKDGSISNNNGGGVTNDAWIVTSGRKNIIVMDNQAYGSLTGFVRCWGGGAREHLYEDNTMHRSHSDTIHLTYDVSFMTARRNNIFDSGDDAISVVSYNKASGPAPTNILVERNNIHGGRARGLTVVGGFDVLHQFNHVERTNLAAFLYAAASSHSTYSVTAVCRNNTIYRSGQRDANFVHSGVAVACFTYSTETVDIEVTNNKAYPYRTDQYTNDFVRGTGGGVTAVESGNSVDLIDSSE